MFKVTSGNTNQQSVTNVIDELWQIAAIGTCIARVASVCVRFTVRKARLFIHMRMIFYSADVPAWSHSSEQEDTRMQPKTLG